MCSASFSLLYSLFIALYLSCSSSSVNALTLPRVLSSHMTLQRSPFSARIWGTSLQPYSLIRVTLDGVTESFTAFSDANNQFTVNLKPQAASVNRTLMITAIEGNVTSKQILSDVAFGDVFVCSGQSNMVMSVQDSFDGQAAVEDSVNYPHVRLFSISEEASLTPLNDTVNRWKDGQQWVRSAPQYVGGSSFYYFSALCYYFGRQVFTSLNYAPTPEEPIVPIGLIMTAWNGTRIRAWSSPAANSKCGVVTPASLPRVRDERRASFPSSAASLQLDPDLPSVLFNAMIHPILNYRVKGVVWYQASADTDNPEYYSCAFPAMILDWRQQFENADLFFAFGTLVAYKEGGSNWTHQRDAQMMATRLPLVSAVNGQDLGDESSPWGGIHSRNKTIFGQRYALAAQASLYRQDVIADGPLLGDVIWPLERGTTQSVILRYSSLLLSNQGLNFRDTSGCDLCCRNPLGSAFTIGTNLRRVVRTRAQVIDSIVIVQAENLAANEEITSIAHGYENYQNCCLYNRANLPYMAVNISRY